MHVISSVDVYIFENIIMTDMMTVIRAVRLWLNRRIVYTDLGVLFSDLPLKILNDFPILRF